MSATIDVNVAQTRRDSIISKLSLAETGQQSTVIARVELFCFRKLLTERGDDG